MQHHHHHQHQRPPTAAAAAAQAATAAVQAASAASMASAVAAVASVPSSISSSSCSASSAMQQPQVSIGMTTVSGKYDFRVFEFLTNVDLTGILCHLNQVNWLTKIDVAVLNCSIESL